MFIFAIPPLEFTEAINDTASIGVCHSVKAIHFAEAMLFRKRQLKTVNQEASIPSLRGFEIRIARRFHR
ncbi:hypothetical protein DWW45_10075 [Sutterella sp. AF15-44LB]|nr:hypothetical protein DWW45_10075 [Sutterella sp. AF15-44LB]RHH03920.1 hypothetical protein DW229_11075 [Sutterella sp. AM18-8-1]